METHSEKKSNYVAFGFTISIHMFLFFIFVFTVFVKPQLLEKASLNSSANSINSDELYTLETVEMQRDNNSVSRNISSSFIADHKENDVRLSDLKQSVKKGISEDSNSSELQKALLKFHDKKNNKSGNLNAVSSGIVIGGDKNSNDKVKEVQVVDSYIQIDRKLISKPEAILNSYEEGKVVVEIIVDENGKVVLANPGQRGSTTTSSNLYSKARQAAYQAKFNQSPEGIKEQRGTYTFVFTLE